MLKTRNSGMCQQGGHFFKFCVNAFVMSSKQN